MTKNKVLSTFGVAFVLAASQTAVAMHVFETTSDEAGSRIVNHGAGTTGRDFASPFAAPLSKQEVSPDRQFVYLGDEGGWQLRPMEYRITAGRLVHVDDPVGHMHAEGDSSRPTAAQRSRLERGGR